ncbi:MAG: peptide-N-glycosidase F-related protein [Planctomycetota bacterium]|jgi:hypothetical protein
MQAILIALATALALLAPRAAAQVYETVSIVREAEIHLVKDVPLLQEPDGFVQRFAGQVVERTVSLPAAVPPIETRRIVARLRVTPVTSMREGRRRPNDPWNRLGSVAVLVPPTSPGKPSREVELMRFVTGYGGGGVFEQDVTTLAPLLHGPRTFRLFVSSYSDLPGWTVSLELVYSTEGIGYRRPALALPLFNQQHLVAEPGRRAGRVMADIQIPPDLALPRLRLITTGHATDGAGANEFVTATHLLRVDGRVVARWRPWSEDGGRLRSRNPWAGRRMLEGREVWASDLDRSGWHPGEAVTPMILPLPELTPGPHRIELEIRGIRPESESGEPAAHGFWAVSAVVVADEPWAE